MKQFGEAAARVTIREMCAVFMELKEKVGGRFAGFELTLTLEEKKDHGDIDILVLLHPEQNVKKEILSLRPLQHVRNGYCHSFLYRSDIGKDVHIDFLVSSDPNLHRTKKQYYAFNVLSAALGMVAKFYNYKYGSEGFFKRYKDKRGNWHDILISTDLNIGLRILGYESKPLWLKTYKDVVDYVSSSLLFSSSIFDFALKDRTKAVFTSLAGIRKKAVITDSDYFLKRAFPEHYRMVSDKVEEIEEKTYARSRFNGEWLMEKFGMKPGPQMGKVLKAISDYCDGEDLSDVAVEEFVRSIL